jgi:hypothetical protein
MAQVLEGLPSKPEVLSSNPVLKKKKGKVTGGNTCNPSFGKAEARESRVGGQPGLHRLSTKTKNKMQAECSWLTPVILATKEAEIRWITIQSQPLANTS